MPKIDWKKAKDPGSRSCKDGERQIIHILTSLLVQGDPEDDLCGRLAQGLLPGGQRRSSRHQGKT